ncbi:MAG: MoaD/ThiS family protein [Myxococcota bacterium]
MASIELTRHLFQFFPQLADRPIEVEAATVAEAVKALELQAPGIGFYLCDERGRLRPHVNIFVGKEAVRDRFGLSDAIGPTDRLFILQALSGG